MIARQKQLVRETYPEIREIAIPVSMLLYGRLFDLDPSLRQLFQIDMREQSTKLMAMLETIVVSLDRFEELAPELREMGRRHAGYGVKPEHYDTLALAMVWAFGQAIQASFSPEVREAWQAVIQEVSHEMKLGAAAAAVAPPV